MSMPATATGTPKNYDVSAQGGGPAALDTQQVPVEASQTAIVAHSGDVNVIDPYLKKHFILNSIFRWTTAMPAGTIIRKIPVHPSYANPQVQHLSQMYNLWAGSLDYKIEIAGTGFHGGRLLVAKVPPNLNPDDYTPQGLTVFHNVEIEVKQSMGGTLTAIDQKNIVYHYNSGSKPELGSVDGGTLVIIVLYPLVLAAEQNGSVNLGLYSKLGDDFVFSQMQPVLQTTTYNPTHLNNMFRFDHRECLHPVVTACVFKKLRVSKNQKEVYHGLGFLAGADDTRRLFKEHRNDTRGCSNTDGTSATPVQGFTRIFESQVQFGLNIYHNGGNGVTDQVYTAQGNVSNPAKGYVWLQHGIHDAVQNENAYCAEGTKSHLDPIAWYEDPLCPPPAPVSTTNGEGIVYFQFDGDTTDRGCLQDYTIMSMFRAGALEELALGESVVFQLVDARTNNVLNYVRLHREGFMSAVMPATSTEYDLRDIYLRYMEKLPVSNPLPGSQLAELTSQNYALNKAADALRDELMEVKQAFAGLASSVESELQTSKGSKLPWRRQQQKQSQQRLQGALAASLESLEETSSLQA
ncbi:hypothetical protein 2 [Beihai sipunculid worm virus 5]|uniref:hypothetical protein 2 n=1 Tax=Beihai sipunculid worm virus 5 TaxID=1922677 RepID=UPI00090B4737|nr:hypothetical protein 2 [Beihai sipunculid worm virus 5]APG76866.1 hypothetical protein 2 [Beihai sipunculid worm virus 5]